MKSKAVMRPIKKGGPLGSSAGSPTRQSFANHGSAPARPAPPKAAHGSGKGGKPC